MKKSTLIFLALLAVGSALAGDTNLPAPSTWTMMTDSNGVVVAPPAAIDWKKSNDIAALSYLTGSNGFKMDARGLSFSYTRNVTNALAHDYCTNNVPESLGGWGTYGTGWSVAGNELLYSANYTTATVWWVFGNRSLDIGEPVRVKFAVPSLGQNTHLHVAFMGGSSIRFCTVTGASPWVATAIDMTLTNAEAGVTGIVFSVDASASPPYSATLTNLHFIANQFLTNTVTNFYLSTEQPKTSNTGVIADFDCERAMIDTAINDAAAAAYQAAADYVDAFPVASASLATGLDWQILGNYDFTQNSFTNDGDVTEAWTNLEGNTHNAWQTNAGWGLHAGGTNLCWTLGTTTQNVYRITWRLIAYGSSPSSVVLMPRGETKSAGYPVAVTYTSMFYTLKHTGRIDFKVASYYDTPFLQSCKIEAAYDTNYFNKFDARLEPSRDKVIDIGNPTNRWKTGYFESVDVGTSIWFSATERLAFRTTNLYWCVAGNTGLVNITWGTPMP